MEKQKIVHLTSVHAAGDVRIFHKECRSLAKAGYSVTLVAPAEGDDLVDGVFVRAVKRTGGRFSRITRTVYLVYRAALSCKADLYHFHDPELIFVGIILKLRGKHVVYDVHEDVPKDIMSKLYIPIYMRFLLSKVAWIVEIIGAWFFDAVVTVTPTIAKRFPSKKTVLVQNYPILDEFSNYDAYSQRADNIIYVGGLEKIRGIHEMVEAMSFLPDDSNAKLVLAGHFYPKALEEQIKESPGWARADFVGWKLRKDIPTLFANAKIGLLLFHPVPNHIDAQPNKLFEYMSSGLPVIASDFPLWREIVEGNRCGLLVDPLDARAIADAIMWLLENPKEAEAMGRRGKMAVTAIYNWDTESSKLVDLYKKLL